MSPDIPRQPVNPSRADVALRLPAVVSRRVRLASALCAVLALPLATFALQQSGQDSKPQESSSPTAAPSVRPRTVAPKMEDAPPAPAQDTDAGKQIAETVDEDEVVRVDSNLVLVPASVVDNGGRAITDLKLGDFELRVDGEVKPISDLGRAETPVLIALLFDNSASLSAARAFEKQAATRFFQSVVRKIDRAAVYSISTVPMLSQPLTSNVTRLVATIEGFPQPEGATALFDTIAQAADYLRPFTGRKVILLVSDGTDTVSDIAFDAALNRVLRSDSQVYVVQTRQVEDPNLHDPVSEGLLAKLTEQTGGAVYAPQSVEDLDSAFTQIALDIGQQYLLSYYPQDERKDKYFRFINLRVKARPNLRVRARKGFYPTTAQHQPATPGGNLMTTERRAGGSEFVASAARPGGASEGPRPSPNGIIVSRGGGDAGVTRRVGPAGPDDDEHAKRPVNLAPSIPENAAPAGASRPENVNASRVPPRLAPSPTPAMMPAPASARPAETAKESSTRPTAPPDAKETPKRAPVSGGVLNGKALSLPKPVYTPVAKSAGASGVVVVEVVIDVNGRVSKARAVSGHPLLQKAAVQAALQAKFSPTILSGEPVPVEGTIKYNFMSQ